MRLTRLSSAVVFTTAFAPLACGGDDDSPSPFEDSGADAASSGGGGSGGTSSGGSTSTGGTSSGGASTGGTNSTGGGGSGGTSPDGGGDASTGGAPTTDSSVPDSGSDAPTDGSAPVDASTDTGVSTDSGPDATVDSGIPTDSGVSVDSGPDAVSDGGTEGGHLLITEVKTTDQSEFVEIYNPTAQVVDLRNYYLTDVQEYPQLPAVVAGNATVITDQTDFLVRFPIGATIAPGQAITVAMDAVGFETALASVPTYAVQELGNSTAMEVIWIAAGGPNPGLTNTGEFAALLFWDGVSDTVKDVDIVIAGNALSAGNALLSKTGLAVDGPDADSATTTYATDAFTIPDMETDTPNATSYKRIALENGNETQSGTGNGITGDDETSEQCRATWDNQASAANYTAPTPGVVPAALIP